MQSPLHRLYQIKLVLASLIGVVAGYILMVVGTRIDGLSGFGLLKDIDLHDIGIVLMTSGLIVVLFQYLGNEDAEAAAEQRTRKAVKAEAPAFVAGVLDAIADTPEQVLSVTAPEVLDRVIENSMSARLGDKRLAHDTYADLYHQVVQTTERWHDVHVDVDLAPWEPASNPGEEAMFVATIKWEYRRTAGDPIMRFACVSAPDEYRSLSRDPSTTETWYFKPTPAFDGASPEVFELLQFTVDGKPHAVRRTASRGTQLFTADLGEVSERGAVVSYTYRTLVRRRGHLLRIEPARLTKGFAVRFSYGGCGIQFVNALDYIAGAWQARLGELPPSDPAPSSQVSYDGWVFPRGGAVFVWGLEDEARLDDAPTHAAA
jgi:hypothetical protein